MLHPMVSAAGHVSALGSHLANHTTGHRPSFNTATHSDIQPMRFNNALDRSETQCKHQHPTKLPSAADQHLPVKGVCTHLGPVPRLLLTHLPGAGSCLGM